MTQMSIKKKNGKKKRTLDNPQAGNELDKLMLQVMMTGGENPQPDDNKTHNMSHEVSLMRALLGQDIEQQVGHMPSQVSASLGTSAGTMRMTKA